jgi:hypothetical protein
MRDLQAKMLGRLPVMKTHLFESYMLAYNTSVYCGDIRAITYKKESIDLVYFLLVLLVSIFHLWSTVHCRNSQIEVISIEVGSAAVEWIPQSATYYLRIMSPLVTILSNGR